jgi:nitroreductase
MMLAQPLVRFMFGAALVATVVAFARHGWGVFATPYLPYVIVSWALQTAVMTGVGAENHNLIEPMLATLLWIVVATQDEAAPLRIGWLYATALGALAVCATLELRNPDVKLWSYTDRARTERYVRERAAAQAALRSLGIEHGRMLNLKNSQIPHDFAGDMVLNDVWMYITVLWNSRPETVDRLVAAIGAERFDVVIVSPGVTTADPNRSDSPWARISHAVFAHYQLAYHGGEVNLLTRRR